MRFDILTLFPEMFERTLGESIIGRAKDKGIFEINYTNIRDFAGNKHNRVDDYPYGGGAGMVMQAEPVYSAWESITKQLDYKPKTIYLSPQGKTFRQSTAKRLAKEKHIILICGHYEGLDQRVIDEIVDEEISIGDFVLTGGELAAMAVVDATARLLPGVLSSEESFSEESHFAGLLEYPQYTRPQEFMGLKVPGVLTSGNHGKVDAWREEKSREITLKNRPDLLKKGE